MLFLLTGDVQIGKTRWLESVTTHLAAEGVPVAGVLAPGVWRERQAGDVAGNSEVAGVGRFEKLGIDNLLLPERTRVPFARRRDLALAEGSFDEGSQSAQAQLAWEISDDALAQVNAHFDALANADCTSAARPGFLVVDELGQLELLRDGGLTSAVALLDGGATERFPHALAVVRTWLLDRAQHRFAAAWGGTMILSPNNEARAQIGQQYALASIIDNGYH